MENGLEVAQPQQTKLAMIRPIVSPKELIDAHKESTALIREALEEGKDYGVIPGTGQKPTLLKPGAERLLKAFGCYANYTIVSHEIDHDREVKWTKKKYGKIESGTSTGLYTYDVRCEVVTYNGQKVGSGIGSCSTMESKYIDRPRDCQNTALKMAQKRAMVAAVLNAFGLSDRFTQDVEDTTIDVTDMRRATVENREETREEPVADVYDKADRTKQDWLIKQLKASKVPEARWDAVGNLLHGKPAAALKWAIGEAGK